MKESDLEKIRKLTVLVVDDVSNMRQTLKRMLRIIGCKEVIDSANGEAALNLIKNRPVDFIICDWNMPDMSGIEFLRNLRDNPSTHKVPFLMISGEVLAEKIVLAAESEIDGYIIKPFYTKTLEDKMASILNRKEAPSPFDTIMEVAEVYLNSNQYDKAIAECNKAIELNPKSARARNLMGQAFLKKGMKEAAVNILEEAREMNPQFLRSTETLAQFYMEEGDDDSALNLIEEAVKISPNNPKRQVNLGTLYLKKNRVDKAKKAFEVAIKNKEEGSSNTMKTVIAEAFLENGYDSEAVEAFEHILEGDCNDLNAYNKLGIALRKQGRHQEAIENYKRALKFDEQDEVLHYNIARAYHDCGLWDKAKEHIEHALRLVPNFKEAKDFHQKLMGE